MIGGQKMTNREWLLNKMQNMSDEEFVCFSIPEFVCGEAKGNECKKLNWDCIKCGTNWLKAEHKEKITLSEAERIILENINKEYKWIGRFQCGRLFLFNDMEKPYRDDDGDWHGYGVELDFYDHLFQFITWNDSEPYNIAELLKGEK